MLTDEATNSTSSEILDKLMKLKTLKITLPETVVIFSAPTIIRSDNGKAVLTVRNLCDQLVDLNMDILDDINMTGKHLGRKTLH